MSWCAGHFSEVETFVIPLRCSWSPVLLVFRYRCPIGIEAGSSVATLRQSSAWYFDSHVEVPWLNGTFRYNKKVEYPRVDPVQVPTLLKQAPQFL